MSGEGSQVTKQQGQGTQCHTSTHHTASQALIAPGSSFASAYTHTEIHVQILVCVPVYVCVHAYAQHPVFIPVGERKQVTNGKTLGCNMAVR